MQQIVAMVMAEAAKSNVDKRKVGCVIIGENGELHGTGFNHVSERVPVDVSQPPEHVHLHAEMMALEEAGSHVKECVAEGTMKVTVYVSHAPCKDCAEHLLKAGFTNIVIVEEFMKFDTDKIRYDLVPPKVLESIAQVITYGAKKYKPNNWRKCQDLSAYEAAMMRHFEAYRMGEFHDEESGLPHLAHAITNLVYLQELADGD